VTGVQTCALPIYHDSLYAGILISIIFTLIYITLDVYLAQPLCLIGHLLWSVTPASFVLTVHSMFSAILVT
jgi:hypothetical protein